jgi:hypothetical protein
MLWIQMGVVTQRTLQRKKGDIWVQLIPPGSPLS